MEDVSLLQKVIFFKDLTDEELSAFGAIATSVSFKLGQKILEEGAECDTFFVIKSGSVIVKTKNMVIAQLEQGEPIGEVAFIDKGARSASVTAIEETELFKVSSADFHTLLESNPKMAAKIYRAIATILCRRLRETGDVINLRFQPVKF